MKYLTGIGTILLIAVSQLLGGGREGLKGPQSGVPAIAFTPRTTELLSKGQGPGIPIPFHYRFEHEQKPAPARTRNLGGGRSPAFLSSAPGGRFAATRLLRYSATMEDGWIPSDAGIAVGPNHVVVCTNEQIDVYSRKGKLVAHYSAETSFFPTDAGGSFDPKCYYDAASGHFVVIFDQASEILAFINIAVSQTSDPTGAWWKYHVDWTLDGTTRTTNWGDYPGLGYNDNAIFISTNQFTPGGDYAYSKIRIFSKAQLFSGAPATWIDFIDLRNSDGSSAFTVKPVCSLTRSASEYLLNTQPDTGQAVTLWRIDNAPDAPVLNLAATIPVDLYTIPPDARQPGGWLVSTGDARTQDVVMQNDTLYTAFTENYTTPSFDFGSGIRYLVLSTDGVKQKDVSYFTKESDWFYPSVTVNPEGDMFMVFCGASSGRFPSMYVTGMKRSETAIEKPLLVKAGVGMVTDYRWGDYTAIAKDWTNPDTAWLLASTSHVGGAWGAYVQALAFKHPKGGRSIQAALSPRSIHLNASYPNPFNPTATIRYTLDREGYARLTVYNVLGQQVAVLFDGEQTAGEHEAVFDGSELSSGIYFSRLEANNQMEVQRMLLAK